MQEKDVKHAATFRAEPTVSERLLSGYIVWAVMKVIIGIRQIVHWCAGARLQDKGSRLIITGTLGLGIFLCWQLPYTVLAATITSASIFVFWLGIVLIYVGLAFRLYAIIILGRYFTPSVIVAADQRVVEDGPYKLIRHPSYTGLLIIFLGFGLSSINWLSLLALMGCALIGLSYRIRVEERIL